MAQQRQLSVEEMDTEWLSDPFLMDSNLDVSCLSPELRAKYFAKKGIKDPTQHKPDPFDSVSDPFQVRDTHKANYDDMLRNPEVLRDLAERDPQQLATWQDKAISGAIIEFRKQYPSYLKTAKNADAVTQWLAGKHLGKDYLNGDEAARELVSRGLWTPDTLGEAYRDLLRSGKLEVPKGTARQLTRKEQLEVIAVAQQEGVAAGAIRYLEIALGGLPNEADIAKWRSANATLWNYSLLFTWFNSRPGISGEQFEDFRRSLSRYPLLTVELIEKCWADFNRGVPLAPGLEEIAQEAEQAVNPDDLSNEELNERIRKTREALRKQRGY